MPNRRAEHVLDVYASLTFNLVKFVTYVALIPVAFFFGWMDVTAFVSLLSIWALAEAAGGSVVTAILRRESNNSPGGTDGEAGSGS